MRAQTMDGMCFTRHAAAPSNNATRDRKQSDRRRLVFELLEDRRLLAADAECCADCEFGLLEWLQQVAAQLPTAAETAPPVAGTTPTPGVSATDASFLRIVLAAVPTNDLSVFMNDVVARSLGQTSSGAICDPATVSLPVWTADNVIQWMGDNPHAAGFMKDSFNEILRPLVDPLTMLVNDGGPITIRALDEAQYDCHFGLYYGDQLLTTIEDLELPIGDLPPDWSIELQLSQDELADIARQLADIPLLLDRVVSGMFRFAPGAMVRIGMGSSPSWEGQLPNILTELGQRTYALSTQLPGLLLKAIAAHPSWEPTSESPDGPTAGSMAQLHRWQIQISEWLKFLSRSVDELVHSEDATADKSADDSEAPALSKRAQAAAGVLDEVISGIQDFTSEIFGDEAIYVEPRLGIQELIFGGVGSNDSANIDPRLHWSAAVAMVVAAEIVHRRRRRVGSISANDSSDSASSSRRRSSSLTGIWESGLSHPSTVETSRDSRSTSSSQWIRFGSELAPTTLNLQT